MKRMLDTRSSAGYANQVQKLSRKTVDKADGWVCQNLVQITQFCDLLLSKTVFIKRKIFESINRNLEIHNTLLAGPSHCFPAKKGRTERHFPSDWPTWSGVSFLNTEQLLARRVTYHQQNREHYHALLGGLPDGGEGCFRQEALWRTSGQCSQSVHAENILKVYLGLEIWSILLD